MDLEFIYKEFNKLQERIDGPKIIFISDNFSLSEFAEGESGIKFLESSQVLSKIKDIAVETKYYENQRMSIRLKKLVKLKKQKFLEGISKEEIDDAVRYLSKGNYIIHGDLNKANIIFNNDEVSFIDFDTIMIAAKPMELALIDIYEKVPTYEAWFKLYGIKDKGMINKYIKAAAIYKLFE